MTDRTILKKMFECGDNGIDFVAGLDEDLFDEAFSRMQKEIDIKTTALECLVLCVKILVIERLEEMILSYGKDEEPSDHAVTVKGMTPYDDIRCEILPDDTPLLYLDQRDEYERKFKDTIISDLESQTHIRFNSR